MQHLSASATVPCYLTATAGVFTTLGRSPRGAAERVCAGGHRRWRSEREERTHATVTGEPSVVGEVERYLELYRSMVLIRGFEDLIQSLFLRGEIYGTTHLYTGQEAVAVGVASVLEDRDRVAATYRGHGHALALGVDPQAHPRRDARSRHRRQRRPRRLDEHQRAARAPRRLVRDRRRDDRRGDGRRPRAQAGRRRRRLPVRRRRDQPGLLLRVPELLRGDAACPSSSCARTTATASTRRSRTSPPERSGPAPRSWRCPPRRSTA